MAAGPNAIRKQAEASMQVTGQIDIEADGSVSDYRIDHREKLSPDLVSLLENTVDSWKFQPVLEGDRPVAVSTKVSVRLIAKPADDGSYTVRIGGAAFESDDDGYAPRKVLIGAPSYPRTLAQRGATGTVYLVLKVGRQGTVEDAIAEQVNLHVVASAARMKQMRDEFANSALKAARGWTFALPVAGPEVDASHWSLRVPVDFILSNSSTVSPAGEYGRWIGYVPGPRRSIPWSDNDEDFQAAPDAMLAGNFYSSRNNGPRLLTALGSD
ncbi:MAG: energy transducer TonB [Pseudomonadota bacterium]|nr:energy transducer TonB [Pseudomonadota bacterium]